MNMILRRPRGCALLLTVACSLCSAQAHAFVLVEEGRPRAKLVVAAPSNRWVDGGVKDFVDYIEKISGARIARSAGVELAGGPVVLVRKIERVRNLPKGAFTLTISPKGITIQAWHEQGLNHGLIELLDRLGVRWYWPGELGELVPKMRTIEFPNGEETIRPDYILRDGIHGCKHGSLEWRRAVWAWARRNRYGGWTWHGAGHSYAYLVPPRKYFKEHPEYFALVKGKRVPDNLCVSNSEVARIAIRSATKWLRRNYRELVCVSPPDGYVKCECENCRKLDHPKTGRSDRVTWFANQVAAGIVKEFPNARVLFINYVDYQCPPARVEPHPNVATWYVIWSSSTDMRHQWPMASRHNPKAQALFLANAAVFKPIGFHPYYGHYFWFTYWPQVQNMARDIPWAHEHGATMFYSETHQHWATQGLNFFFMYRLTWKTRTDIKAELDRYHGQFLGPAGPAMREFERVILNAFRSRSEGAGTKRADANFYTPKVLRKARALMEEAKKACAAPNVNPLYARRTAFLERGLTLTELWTNGIRAMQAFGVSRKKADRHKAAQSLKALYDMLTRPENVALVESKPVNVPGKVKKILDRFESPGTRFAKGKFFYRDTFNGGGRSLLDAKVLQGFFATTYGLSLKPRKLGILEWEFEATEGVFHDVLLGINDPVKHNPGTFDVSLSLDGAKIFTHLPFEQSNEFSRKGGCRLVSLTELVRGKKSFLIRITAKNKSVATKLVLDHMRIKGEIR